LKSIPEDHCSKVEWRAAPRPYFRSYTTLANTQNLLSSLKCNLLSLLNILIQKFGLADKESGFLPTQAILSRCPGTSIRKFCPGERCTMKSKIGVASFEKGNDTFWWECIELSTFF
jgi:hypothetical protein